MRKEAQMVTIVKDGVGPQPGAIRKLCCDINDFAAKAKHAALSLYTISYFCCSLFGSGGLQRDIAGRLMAVAGGLSSLSSALDGPHEVSPLSPRDVGRLSDNMQACEPILTTVASALQTLDKHLNSDQHSAGLGIPAKFNAFNKGEEVEPLRILTKCCDVVIKATMIARRDLLSRRESLTDDEARELEHFRHARLQSALAYLEYFTSAQGTNISEPSTTFAARPRPPPPPPPPTPCYIFAQCAALQNTPWIDSSPSSITSSRLFKDFQGNHVRELKAMSEGQIQEDLLGAHPAEEMATAARNDDTPVSTREGTPAEEAINTGAADGEVPGSVATAEGEKEKVRSTADKGDQTGSPPPAPPMPGGTAGVEHTNHDAAAPTALTSTFTLSPTQHLESYVLRIDMKTSKNTMTCTQKAEYLDIDSDALLASMKSLPPSYSVFESMTDLHPRKRDIIQELTRSRSGRVVAINSSDSVEKETSMGTLKVTSVSFIIKVDAEKEKKQRKEHKEEQWNETKPAFNFATRSTSQQPANLFATAAPTSDSSSEDSDSLQATALHCGQREKAAAEELASWIADVEKTSYFAEKDGHITHLQAYQSITFLPHYQRESFEEMRVKDYASGYTDSTMHPSTLPGAISGALAPSRVADLQKKRSELTARPQPSAKPFAGFGVPLPSFGGQDTTGGSLLGAKLAPSTRLFAHPPVTASGGFGFARQNPYHEDGSLFGRNTRPLGDILSERAAATTTGGSLFGQAAAANTGSSLFSQGPSQSQGLSGQGASSAFNRPIPGTGTSLFGNPGSSQYGGGLPGFAEAQASLFGAPLSGNLVGDPLKPAPGGLFSAAAAPLHGSSLFGRGASKPSLTGDPLGDTLFGGPSTPAPKNLFDPSQPAFRWGPSAETSRTTVSGGLFSSGAQPTKPTPFGANDNLSPGIFASTAQAQPTGFGSTNQQNTALDEHLNADFTKSLLNGVINFLNQPTFSQPSGLFSDAPASIPFPDHPALSTANIFAYLANASAPNPSPANGFSNPASFSNLALTLRQKTEGPSECQKCATLLHTHSRAELEDRLCDICTGKKETLCWACERKTQSAVGEAGREVDTAIYEARFAKMFRGMKMPEAMREFLRNQPRLSKSERGGRGEDAAEDKEDGKGKEKETNESEQTRKQESSDTTTAYDLQAAAAEDEDIKRMIAEFEAKELQWKNNEKAYAAKKAAAVVAENAKVAQRVSDEDERLRQLEREADEAEEARILRREDERKTRAEKTAAGKRSGTIEKSKV